jgi:undecaprenyl-diphosphatase
MFAVGFVASFIAALLAVKALLRFISSHDFTAFAWYRIAFGLMILITAYFNVINWSDS